MNLQVPYQLGLHTSRTITLSINISMSPKTNVKIHISSKSEYIYTNYNMNMDAKKKFSDERLDKLCGCNGLGCLVPMRWLLKFCTWTSRLSYRWSRCREISGCSFNSGT